MQFAIFFVTFNYVEVQIIILVVTLNVQLTLTIHMDGLIMGHMRCNVGMFIFFQVSNASLHTCPFLDLQTIFIPANVQRELVVKAAQLPKPKVVN